MHDGILEVEQANTKWPSQAGARAAERTGLGDCLSALGTAWTRLKDYEKALPILQKAVELKTDSGWRNTSWAGAV